jgi:hypothetical protein
MLSRTARCFLLCSPLVSESFTFVQIPTPNPAVHVYEAVPKAEEADFGGMKSPMKGTTPSHPLPPPPTPFRHP